MMPAVQCELARFNRRDGRARYDNCLYTFHTIGSPISLRITRENLKTFETNEHSLESG